MKKRGFTLIETLISIFIFGIIISAVFSSFAFSIKLFKTIDTKTYLQLYEDAVFSDFKDKDSCEIKKLYENGIKNSRGVAGQFISFNNSSELKEALKNLSFNSLIDSGSYDEAKAQGSTKSFTAFCGISNVTAFSSGFKSYTLTVRIIDNKSATLNGVENERDFIISE